MFPTNINIKSKSMNFMDRIKSKFNVFIPEENGSNLVYNTLRGSISRANLKLAQLLEKGDTSFFETENSRELTDCLSEQGIIVPSQFDELEEYSRMHQRWKEGRENVEFNALLTYDCNFECPYCYQGRGEKGWQIHGFRYMGVDLLNTLKRFIKNTTIVRGANKLELVLYGGEPFLPGAREIGRELTDDIAEWTNKNGINFGLNVLSNGSLINRDIVNWLSGYKARLQIPIDGDPVMHNRYRFFKKDRRGSFEDVIKVLSMTKGKNIETHIRISLTDETYPTMENLLDELNSRGLTHVYPDFCYITAFTDACAGFEEHTLSDIKLFKIMPELWRKAHEKGFPLDIRPRVQPLPCSSVADGSFIVDPFGEVYKCWELVGLKEHMVGRLDSDGNLIKTLVYGDVLERNPLNIKQCNGHSYLPACGGGCVCKAQWRSKTYHAPGCGTERFLLKDKVKVYVETLGVNIKPVIESDGFELQKIEGRQQPQMSHCYVLV